jgi:purine nucleoside phosphorylase
MTSVAFIVGSGFGRSTLKLRPLDPVDTPYGLTSSPLHALDLDGIEVVVIARHGLKHQWAPHAVNYRANIWALRELGTTHCLAFNVVGGINADLTPGSFAVPHQLIDYTWGRESSFGRADGGVEHIEFTRPFSAPLRGTLEAACEANDIRVQRGVYAVTQGPRLETAAEIDRLERDGCDMVGMTAMPEAALAREAGIEYALLAGVINHAAGRAPGDRSLHAEMTEVLDAIMHTAQAVLSDSVRRLSQRNM